MLRRKLEDLDQGGGGASVGPDDLFCMRWVPHDLDGALLDWQGGEGVDEPGDMVDVLSLVEVGVGGATWAVDSRDGGDNQFGMLRRDFHFGLGNPVPGGEEGGLELRRVGHLAAGLVDD